MQKKVWRSKTRLKRRNTMIMRVSIAKMKMRMRRRRRMGQLRRKSRALKSLDRRKNEKSYTDPNTNV